MFDITIYRRGHKGRIRADGLDEKTHLPVNYWKPDDYHRQWIEAVERLTSGGHDTTCFVTVARDPASESASAYWAVYRLADDPKLRVQNCIYVPFIDAPSPFDLDNPYRQIIDFTESTELGSSISTWECSIADLIAFRKRLLKATRSL